MKTFKIIGFCILGLTIVSFAFRLERRLASNSSVMVADSGKIIYTTYCLPCHQADGRGVPKQNPPLVKTDWVLGDKTRLIKVVLNGLNDPIEINDEEYANAMPAHAFLSDTGIADVLTYIRNNFGNKAEPVTEEEVKKVRKAS